jgi:chromosome partitioning protein
LRVIAVANQKGGCGKTTTSINLAGCLAFLQKKILLIDLDPQGHSTCGLGIDSRKVPFSLYDLLQSREQGPPDLSDVLLEINPNLFLIPSYEVLHRLEDELGNPATRERRLETLLDQSIQDRFHFDFVIIDCPPNLGVLTSNALMAADEMLIPVEPSFFSLHGLAKISETIQAANQKREFALEVHALLTLFDARTCFAQEVYEEVKVHFKNRLFKTIIHESVSLKEAASAGKSIVQYAPESGAFQDYLNLAVEYLEKEWDRVLPAKELGWENVVHSHFGPRRVVGGILFQVINKDFRSVEIAGDFNNWVPESLMYNLAEEAWQVVIPITNGKFRYKYILDGEWQLDPYHPSQKENDFGTYDSYLELV